MDWKQASSLFIFVFLIINICLGVLYYQKVERSNQIDIANEKVLSFEKENIKLPKELPPSEGVKLNYLSGRSKKFEATNTTRSNTVVKDKVIKDRIATNLPLSAIEPDAIMEDLNIFMATVPYRGTEYILSGIDRINKRILYEQTFNKYPILSNDTAKVVVNYNDNQEAYSYEQSYIENLQEGIGNNNKKKQVVEPRRALEVLYYQNELKAGDEITAVRLGYYSVVPNIEGQVLKPTWQVAVLHKNGKRETFYVDALNPQEPILK
ncbi:hypothetical protein ERX27_09135 [Macrococcus brunensis]|uniref:Regulatory protein YycH-like domain-containing protein n=1 Tax=Macrococcus brunensis TaxID=198483 RepID=A0A4R6BBK5_9STAP|nr:two-component system regulatory protein YycI [Macrococcus brunensis]TDL94364.1 hypothetical protein ERX27_09135 [Macrococcus brunensis]ULG74215.1 two-component system regulatory protein YycI [Macrococcus brunensis]